MVSRVSFQGLYGRVSLRSGSAWGSEYFGVQISHDRAHVSNKGRGRTFLSRSAKSSAFHGISAKYSFHDFSSLSELTNTMSNLSPLGPFLTFLYHSASWGVNALQISLNFNSKGGPRINFNFPVNYIGGQCQTCRCRWEVEGVALYSLRYGTVPARRAPMCGEVESDHGAFLLQAGHGDLGVIARVQNLLAYKSDQRHSCVALFLSRFHTSSAQCWL